MYTKNRKAEKTKSGNLLELGKALLPKSFLNLALKVHSTYRAKLQPNRLTKNFLLDDEVLGSNPIPNALLPNAD